MTRRLVDASVESVGADKLDRQQVRLLVLLGRGCSLRQAAATLGLTPRTAERRLGAARSALGALTTAHAIALTHTGTRGDTSAAVLTPRERRALELVALGLTSRQIAERSGCTSGSVDARIRSAATKLGARTRLEAVARLQSAWRTKVAGFVDERAGLRP